MIRAMDERDLGLLAAEWEANLLARERVPVVACELLQEGLDTPSLRVAAGLLRGELDEAHQVFGRALAELGYGRERDWRGHGEALAREYAERALDGRMPLVEAVDGIYALSLQFDTEDWALDGESLTTFVVLADLWNDNPAKRRELQADMRAELTRLLDRVRH